MRIVFVQTYPVYHDLLTTEGWLKRNNRDRWMPGLLAQMGHEVELWAGGHETSTYTCSTGDFGTYTIRLFETTQKGKKTKHHYSESLVTRAQSGGYDLFILKGVDGGIGEHLIKKHLIRAKTPFVFIIGGKYYSRLLKHAQIIFYETQAQFDALVTGARGLLRGGIDPMRLILLPKSIDTRVFRPIPDVEKIYDVISVGRLIPNYKSYHALGVLSKVLRVAMVGGGPAAEHIKKRYPLVHWLGAIPNNELPSILNLSKLFIHTSLHDFFPRVLAEAAACGLPCLAFGKAIKEDVLPTGCGLRLTKANLVDSVTRLVRDKNRLVEMGSNSRAYAVQTMSKTSSLEPMKEMLCRIFSSSKPDADL